MTGGSRSHDTAVRKQRERWRLCSACSPFPSGRVSSSWVLPLTEKLGLPISINLIQKLPPRQIQKFVSWMTLDAVKLTVCVSHHPGLPSSTAEGCPSFGRRWAQIAASVTKHSQHHLPFPQSARFVTHWISLTVTEQDWGGCSGSLCSPAGVGLPGKEIFSQ